VLKTTITQWKLWSCTSHIAH